MKQGDRPTGFTLHVLMTICSVLPRSERESYRSRCLVDVLIATHTLWRTGVSERDSLVSVARLSVEGNPSTHNNDQTSSVRERESPLRCPSPMSLSSSTAQPELRRRKAPELGAVGELQYLETSTETSLRVSI